MMVSGLLLAALIFAPQSELIQHLPPLEKAKPLSREDKAVVELYTSFVKSSGKGDLLAAKSEPEISLFKFHDNLLTEGFTVVHALSHGGHSFPPPAAFRSTAGKVGLLSAEIKGTVGEKSIIGLLWCADKLDTCKAFDPFEGVEPKTMTEGSAQKMIGWYLAVAFKAKKVVFLDEAKGAVEPLLQSYTQFVKGVEVRPVGKIVDFSQGLVTGKDGSKKYEGLVVIHGILNDSLLKVQWSTEGGRQIVRYNELGSTVTVVD